MTSTPPSWPTTCAGRGGRDELADDGRRRVGQQHHGRGVRPDRIDPPGQRAAGGDDDVADLDPVVAALAEVTTRRNSDDSRAMTSAATVSWSNPARSWSSAVSCSFSRADLVVQPTVSMVSRSFSARSAALSTRSRSISAIAAPIDAMPPATPSRAPWIGPEGEPDAALDVADDAGSTRTPSAAG